MVIDVENVDTIFVEDEHGDKFIEDRGVEGGGTENGDVEER